jgi:RNA polymerase sigma-70 factor (family 1)
LQESERNTNPEEKSLIRKLISGDEEAFTAIFKKYFTGLCLYAEHYVKDKQNAEEIVEDFFCHLWDNCQNLHIHSLLKSYLYRSVHNRCLNFIRSQKIRQEYATKREYVFSDPELLENPSAENSDLFAYELEEQLRSAIDHLPEQCKSIFSLNRYENKSYQEIADNLGISVNTVKTQMARALHKLREEFKDYLGLLIGFILALLIP